MLRSIRFLLMIVPYLIVLTFLFYPAWNMNKIYDVGKMDFECAQELKKNNFHGAFTTLCEPGI